ncbi:relaxase/mobilization nuclease domain-containing protein [Bariatricus massiliensis]|uniref:Relaxase/mobilization nuclease domain-containing protein n=1 Tax=Bariatricus massiliensis TaxID=1745713 RepID=A0ABS8DBG4_9FIRM|nr:relaxase/mobilization nuclease domain-containing protein [Bariatricus massiliensis]MCB7303674.1 relaxase/mobilization nuclease domain-containing protein [Bariatricus massiliensis]MCB7373090.1 relaxase/mobilization nuclease domain-containing protein [Bariatricus massiliensis]MCB7385760.1 relaxase/mobilization nuclease domain-containing protein [Bariatricus massiliensis]MCB7409922.1 relaxase/mobilization nuclease domain-containing protein [Bariatricus massiliensis]MCQ5253109.1 relaxase/mobili
MATTRLIPMHISKGQTIAQSLKDRFDYGEDPDKTNGGELITAYECDPLTADAEFLLAKAKYKAITGREQKADSDIITYQIRQSFRPGEITPEDANRLGYELAMRWTKGRHAFFVATHVDKAHIHSHIYYNSTALDCTRKFRNFWGSSFAVRRVSDRLCLENGLFIVTDPKPHSKTQFKHYGEWFTGNRPLNFQDRLKIAIDAALAQSPADFAAFLSLMEAAGYEVKQGRGGTLSFRTSGQERFTRLRSSTLGVGYGPEDIRAAISGTRKRPGTAPRKVSLIVDIQAKLKAGKGPGYERWAKVFNLKQMAAALAYLQDNGLTEYGQLEQRAAETTGHFHTLSEQLKATETAMSTNAELKNAIVKYAKTRPVFEAYKAAKYSKKFLAEHEADIGVYRAVRADFERLLHGAKLPRMDALKEESRRLAARKKELYAEYRRAREDMQEVLAAKANIDYLLGYTGQDKNKEQER